MTDLQEKIKVCHICDRITGKADGVFSHLLMLLNNIDKNKYEQIVIYQGGEVVEQELNKMGIKVFVVSGLRNRLSIDALVKIYKILRSENVDIIHAHLIKPYILAGLINIFLKKKFIFNYHGLFINSVYHNRLDKLILKVLHRLICLFRAVDIVVVPSRKSMQLLEDETRLFPKVEVYYNGYDCQKQVSPDPGIIKDLITMKAKFFLIGIIARLEVQKRIDLSLLMLKELVQKGNSVFFIYFGDGPLEEDIKLYAKALDVDNNCKFYGFIKNAKNYFKYLDTILFTSDWEGLPLTYWEAMANSVPVISTDVGGAREILIDNNCGIVYPRGDIEGGVKAIELVIKNETFRRELGENGKLATQSKYNLHAFKTFFENLYNQLMIQ
ncbi:MAG: glycosyltransferase [Ignavibacteriales bacterium]|nr:glycosyltransferase [Ignavibacteriales bacterium]